MIALKTSDCRIVRRSPVGPLHVLALAQSVDATNPGTTASSAMTSATHDDGTVPSVADHHPQSGTLLYRRRMADENLPRRHARGGTETRGEVVHLMAPLNLAS